MNRGLYVDAWRPGLRNQQQVDEMLAFCLSADITDLYVHLQRDWGTLIDYDYLAYILANKGTMRVHGWFSLQVGRDNTWTNHEYNKNWLMAVGNVLMLNPAVVAAKNYFTNRISNFLSRYPTMYGIHIDKLRFPAKGDSTATEQEKIQALDSTILTIRTLAPSYYLTVTVNHPAIINEVCPWQGWLTSGYVNEVYPLFYFYEEADFLNAYSTLPVGIQTVTFPCGNFNIPTLSSRLAVLHAGNMNVNFYSFRYRPFCSTEQEYINMIYGYR